MTLFKRVDYKTLTPVGLEAGDAADSGHAAAGSPRMIGAILVDEGRIAEDDVDRVRRFASEQGVRFGEAAVSLKLVTPEDVDFALARQFDFPVVERAATGAMHDGVAAAHDPLNPRLESLRSLRSQLSLRWLTSARRGVLAISSADRGDGRSWLAANLATAFAQAGQRTLLIDADLRNPCQHRLFNLDNSTGLTALLTGRAAGKDVLHRIHPDLRLFVLTAGQVPPNPQELLMRPVFDTLLNRFAHLFAVVVLDTPAASVASDAHIVAARAGSALLLSRRHHTRLSALKTASADMAATGVQVVGTVINEH